MIRKVLYKLFKWIWDYGNKDESKYQNVKLAASVRENTEADVDGMRFVVMPARGGTIVQLNAYNRRTDESNRTTYIIADGEDVAAEVGKIVSMELIKV